MTPDRNHPWNLTPAEGILLQQKIGSMKLPAVPDQSIRIVAGADVSYVRRWNRAFAAMVFFRVRNSGAEDTTLELTGTRTQSMEIQFPYIPGLLVFREGPALETIWEGTKTIPDLILFDAAGIAHPRRCGLAVHLGWRWDVATIGCAKSRLIGHHPEVGREKGSTVPLMDKKTRIGTVVRTRSDIKPLYVSPGYKTDCTIAVEWVLRTTTRYRLPEPTRIADNLTKQMVREYKERTETEV